MDSDGDNPDDFGTIEEQHVVEIQNSDGEAATGCGAEGNDADGDGEGEGEDDEDKQRKVVKVKRVIRNPQPKLNAETLKGSRGLTALPDIFAKRKFKGKGHERDDLRVLLKTYAYWCHRMFPKYPFEESIEKIEKLGNKKPVITHIKRIRMGLIEEERPLEENDISDDDVQTAVQEPNHDSVFDALLPQAPAVILTPQLTDEQLERIRLNKEKALRLRQERLKKIQQQAESKLQPSNHLTQGSQDSFSSQLSSREQIGRDVDNMHEINVSRLEKDLEINMDSQDRPESPILGGMNSERGKIILPVVDDESIVFEDMTSLENSNSGLKQQVDCDTFGDKSGIKKKFGASDIVLVAETSRHASGSNNFETVSEKIIEESQTIETTMVFDDLSQEDRIILEGRVTTNKPSDDSIAIPNNTLKEFQQALSNASVKNSDATPDKTEAVGKDSLAENSNIKDLITSEVAEEFVKEIQVAIPDNVLNADEERTQKSNFIAVDQSQDESTKVEDRKLPDPPETAMECD